jgi:hypothetical protein
MPRIRTSHAANVELAHIREFALAKYLEQQGVDGAISHEVCFVFSPFCDVAVAARP